MHLELRQIANVRVGPTPAKAVPKLIQRNDGTAAMGNPELPLPSRAAASNQRNRREEVMPVAQQALLLTGELFALSFAAIYVFWFADRLRRGLSGKQ
jgi:hypothetical protein